MYNNKTEQHQDPMMKIQLLHQISEILKMDNEPSSSTTTTTTTASSCSSSSSSVAEVQLIEEALSMCCQELLTRWKRFHGTQHTMDNDDDNDNNSKASSSWTRNDPDSNEFMNHLMFEDVGKESDDDENNNVNNNNKISSNRTINNNNKRHPSRPPPKAVGGIMKIIFSIWNKNPHRQYHRSEEEEEEEEEDPLWRSDVQQCCCIIVMLLGWDSRERASAIVSHGGISCLVEIMEVFPIVERDQMACLVSLVHLMQMSSKRLLVQTLSLPSSSSSSASSLLSSPSEILNGNGAGETSNHNNNHPMMKASPPLADRLLTNIVHAMTTFPVSQRIYQYSCSILLVGFRRGCFRQWEEPSSPTPSSPTARLRVVVPSSSSTNTTSTTTTTPTAIISSSSQHNVQNKHNMIRCIGRATMAVYEGLFFLLGPDDDHTRNLARDLLVEFVGAEMTTKLVEYVELVQCHGAAA